MPHTFATARLLGYITVLLVFLFPLTESFQQPAGVVLMEVTSKRYSTDYLPVVGSYVEYEVSLTNAGADAIEDRHLHVSLVTDDSITHLAANYSVKSLDPRESKTLHLGPFRIEQEGRHTLLAEIDGVSLEYESDSFTAYSEEAISGALFAIPLIAVGAGLTGFSLYRKRSPV